jgi:sugar phosphate isomerase/epimerase
MRNLIDRRDFLRTTGALGTGMGLMSLGGSAVLAAPLAEGAPHAEKLGWQLGCQAYSFNRFTFDEAVDKTASLGLHCIEMYPGQRLSKEKANVNTDETMSAEVRKEVKKKLADSRVKLLCYGVCGLSSDEAGSRKTFEFAKDMGIETIVSEPTPDAFDTIEKLCQEYSINVALHNHPRPSRYWNPDTVLKACKGRSKHIGACADTGHWMRSDLNPIECIKKLEGRIISFHFKDLNTYGEGAHDVPWGTGEGNVKGMLMEIRRQGFKGVFSIEYEYNWLNSLPEIAESVRYFDKVAAELAGKS